MRGRDRERVSQLIVHLDPRSPVAEAYRTIRAGVLSMAHKRDLKVLGITSPTQGEGKSMTSANIAAALGQTDKRVLVISADMRKPRMDEFFGAANDVGLSNVLEGELPFSEAVERADGGIWVLAGGTFPTRPAELLQSPAMAELLAAARKQFDFVIVDCPRCSDWPIVWRCCPSSTPSSSSSKRTRPTEARSWRSATAWSASASLSTRWS